MRCIKYRFCTQKVKAEGGIEELKKIFRNLKQQTWNTLSRNYNHSKTYLKIAIGCSSISFHTLRRKMLDSDDEIKNYHMFGNG